MKKLPKKKKRTKKAKNKKNVSPVFIAIVLLLLPIATLIYLRSSSNKQLPIIADDAVTNASATTPQIVPSTEPITYQFSVPILMYHHIRDYSSIFYDQTQANLSVGPKSFDTQLNYLQSNGYQPTSFADLRHHHLPYKPIILTFDDGYDDAYTQVLPALSSHHFTASFFIITGKVGTPGYLTWQEINTMRQDGMELGGHTVDHIDLAVAMPKVQTQQIQGSLEDLKNNVGIKSMIFCYPSGRYTDTTLQIAQSLGIHFAVTTNPGVATNLDNPLTLPRLRIFNGTSLNLLLGLPPTIITK